MIRKAVFPAAGFGTRFLPATKVVPKELLPIVDKPVVQYLVEEAVAAGIEDVVVANVAKGEKVVITGFLTFDRTSRAARTGRNPQTGEAIKIPAKRVLKFRIAKAMKDAVLK